MSFTILDGIIVAAYLAGIALFGILSGGKQKSARDYFLSESAVPWLAVCLAIVATETSALTFLSIPGLAYSGNLNFLQITIGYIIGRIALSYLLLPRYYDGELSTAYEYLQRRFSPVVRKTASVTFMGTRLFADGVRLYTTAIPLALLLKGAPMFGGIGDQGIYIFAIVVLSLLTLVYVFLGGVRAVIWTDVVQWFIYIGGALVALYYLADLLPQPLSAYFSAAAASGKLNLFQWGAIEGKSFLATPLTLPASILGGFFLSMASHGTDQLIVQRVLATNDLKKGQRAMMLSGILVAFQFALFLAVGTLLYYFYEGEAFLSNEVFAKFIIDHIPTGFTGIIIAGIFAAAMSTLSGSISSLSSATVMDIILPMKTSILDERQKLKLSRWIALAWAFLLIVAAGLFIQTPQTVIELALGIASYTYGGLLGLFLTGILFPSITSRAATAGFIASILGMAAIVVFTEIAWTWYTMCGTLIACAVAWIYTGMQGKEA